MESKAGYFLWLNCIYINIKYPIQLSQLVNFFLVQL